MEVGKGVSDETLQERMDELVANKCCTLVYTVSFDFLLTFSGLSNVLQTV